MYVNTQGARLWPGTLLFLLVSSLVCWGFSIVEAKACAAEFGGEFVHFPADRLVDDAGVDLGGGAFGMAEHFADWFNRYAIGVGYGSCESMAGKVRGYSFLDTQCGGYLFEVEIVFGVAQHGQ